MGVAVCFTQRKLWTRSGGVNASTLDHGAQSSQTRAEAARERAVIVNFEHTPLGLLRLTAIGRVMK